jgi:hypothetical protein
MSKKVIHTTESLNKLMNQDPLNLATEMTGLDLDDKQTSGLGFLLMKKKSEAMRSALKELDDTCYDDQTENYLRIVNEIGFSNIYEESFSKDGRTEKFFMFWNDRGLLLTLDTYRESSINSAKLYYNWRPSAETRKNKGYYENLGSYSIPKICPMDDWVYSGCLDVREALCFKIQQLSQNGKFLSPWMQQPFLWLLNYSEENLKRPYSLVNEEKLKAIPQKIRDLLGPPLYND